MLTEEAIVNIVSKIVELTHILAQVGHPISEKR